MQPLGKSVRFIGFHGEPEPTLNKSVDVDQPLSFFHGSIGVTRTLQCDILQKNRLSRFLENGSGCRTSISEL